MRTLFNIVRRNLKLFFKDKGMFFSSLITPIILLVLYATFLAKVYHDSFVTSLPAGVNISEKLLDGTVVSQLISALLAVSCVTVSFCANLLVIQDKANESIRDFTVSPVKRSMLAAGYYIASAASTLIVTFSALAVCLIYLATKGWYMTFSDVCLVAADVFLLTLFGTALSSCINFFLSTNGQASAVGTIVSAGYGFICGAYMPISTFGGGLQKVLSFLPGTYGTCLIKNHMMAVLFVITVAAAFCVDIYLYDFPYYKLSQIAPYLICYFAGVFCYGIRDRLEALSKPVHLLLAGVFLAVCMV